MQRFSGSSKVKDWHVFQTNGNHCVVGATRMLGLYLTGKDYPTKVVAEAIEAAAADGDSISDDGASLAAALKALRTLGVPFKSR